MRLFFRRFCLFQCCWCSFVTSTSTSTLTQTFLLIFTLRTTVSRISCRSQSDLYLTTCVIFRRCRIPAVRPFKAPCPSVVCTDKSSCEPKSIQVYPWISYLRLTKNYRLKINNGLYRTVVVRPTVWRLSCMSVRMGIHIPSSLMCSSCYDLTYTENIYK
jgi:hypothetical protein